MAVRVQAKSNEPLEKTLRRLRKICNNEGITREVKRHAYYEKPSERRRRRSRITSYNVCYTKLLRFPPRSAARARFRTFGALSGDFVTHR